MQLAAVEQGLGQHLRGIEVDVDHRVPEVAAHLRQGLVAGDPGVVHDNIDALRQRVHQLLPGVRGADVEGHGTTAEARGEAFEGLPGRRHVEQHHFRAVARQGFRDGRANAAGGAGDQCALAGQRLAPVVDLGAVGGKTDHLAGDVGALRREEEAQRAFQLVLGALADVQQLHVAAATDFLAQGAGETFQAALHAGGDRVLERLGGASEDHHLRALVEALEHRLEEVAQRHQLLEAGQAAGVEQHRLGPRAVLGGPARQLELSLDGGEHRVGQLAGEGQHGLGQRAAPADHQRAVHRAHPAGLPALQAQRGGKADGANQAAADGGVGEGDVTIGHGTGSRWKGSKAEGGFRRPTMPRERG